MSRRTDLLARHMRMLHIAPERALADRIRQVPGLQWVSADLFVDSMLRADITALPFAEGVFDAVVCSHVLEHIPDDRAALRELRRILKSDGWAILQVPIAAGQLTFEDPTVTSPIERERLFGQRDHVRIYGRDYDDRLSEAGFRVTRDDLASTLGADGRARYALLAEDVYFCEPRA